MNLRLIRSLTGLFLLLVLALLVLSAFSMPELKALFRRVTVIETWLPEAHVSKGNPVFFRRYRIGTVLAVEPDIFRLDRDDRGVDDWFRVEIGIDAPWDLRITDQFTITVESGALGGLTQTKMVLLAPYEDPRGAALSGPFLPRPARALAEVPSGETVTLRYQRGTSILETAQTELERFVGTTLPKVNSVLDRADLLLLALAAPDGPLVGSLNKLERVMNATADQLEQPDGDLRRILSEAAALSTALNAADGPLRGLLAQLARLVADLEAGDGVAGALLKDAEWRGRVRALLDDAGAAAARLDGLLADAGTATARVKDATASLPELMERLHAIMQRLDLASRSLPGAAEEVRRTLAEARTLLLAIESLPLIRSNVPEKVPPDPLVLPAVTTPPRSGP